MKELQLWKKMIQKKTVAFKSGAILPFETELVKIQDRGVDFIVRVVRDSFRKAHPYDPKKHKNNEFDPFLNYDKNLFVSDITDTHFCLLNKYNVVDYHLLLVTRNFEEQQSFLTPADFYALNLCMKEFNSFAFYNSGKDAGASQRHKHLQLVPVPLESSSFSVPLEAIINGYEIKDSISVCPELPFKHRIIFFSEYNAENMYKHYSALMDALSIKNPLTPYNLLITNSWMMVIPRKKEYYKQISVNALGFAGSLLVMDKKQLEIVKREGPFKILQKVAFR